MGIVLACCLAPAYGRCISDIETSGSWIYLYNEKGKRYKSMSASNTGQVMGWSCDFFVTRNGSWIYLYDSDGKRYMSMSASNTGDVIAVSGNTFTTRNGNWIYTYDSQGKRLNSRPAR